MEEKERYEWNSRFDEAIKDNQTGDIVNAVEVLNKQDKRIKELEEQTYPAYKREHKRRAYLENIEVPRLEKENQQLKQQLSEKDKIIQMQQNIKRFDIGEMLTENIKLKQQLHDLSKKIVEDFYDEIRHRAILEDDYCPDHKLERKYGVRKCLLENIRTTILKKYGDIK